MVIKGNLSIEELNSIKRIKENIYGTDSIHIHNAYVIGELLLKREFSYEQVSYVIKENKLASSTNRTVNTTFRLNQKAYDVLEDYTKMINCSKISIIRAIIYIYSLPEKQHNNKKQLKILSININNFGNLEIKPVGNKNDYNNEKYKQLKKIWNDNIQNRKSLAERLAKWLIVNQIDVILLNEYDVSEYEYDDKKVKVSDCFEKELEAYYHTQKEYSYPKDTDGNTYNYGYGSICVCFVSKQIKNFKICNAPKANSQNKEWTYARWVNVELDVNKEKIIIIGVHIPYGDNDRAKTYWKILLNYCNKHINCKLIILGDFNAYTNEDIAFNNPSSANANSLEALCSYMMDAYREKHPYTPCYSHIENNVPRRLDYIFVSRDMLYEINQIEYLHNMNSDYDSDGFTDHSGLLINVNI